MGALVQPLAVPMSLLPLIARLIRSLRRQAEQRGPRRSALKSPRSPCVGVCSNRSKSFPQLPHLVETPPSPPRNPCDTAAVHYMYEQAFHMLALAVQSTCCVHISGDPPPVSKKGKNMRNICHEL